MKTSPKTSPQTSPQSATSISQNELAESVLNRASFKRMARKTYKMTTNPHNIKYNRSQSDRVRVRRQGPGLKTFKKQLRQSHVLMGIPLKPFMEDWMEKSRRNNKLSPSKQDLDVSKVFTNSKNIREIQKKWVKTTAFKYAQRNKSLAITSGGFLSDEEIADDLNECYGKGKQRKIRPGETAICEKQMKKIIRTAQHQRDQEIQYASSWSIVIRTLREANLNNLEDFPMVIKQLERLWRTITRNIKWNAPPNKKHAKTDRLKDPVLDGIREGERLESKNMYPMSARYRKSFTFI